MDLIVSFRGGIQALVVDGEWVPTIGDPSVMGWVTVAAYFAATVLCFQAWRRARDWSVASNLSGTMVWFWLFLAAMMLVLGVNKQLDLQTWLTVAGKRAAQAQGWYESRRIVQGAFIIGIALAGALVMAALGWRVRRGGPPYWLAFAGAVFVVVFVVIRAASFHHVDQMLGLRLGGLKLNWILELSGVFSVGAAAWLQTRKG